MAIAFGILSTVMGVLSFIGSFVRAGRDEYEKSNESEKCAIGWFILAAVCFK